MMTASTVTLDLPRSAPARREPPPLPTPRVPTTSAASPNGSARLSTKRRARCTTQSFAPGRHIGPWRIEHELGRGGMATVYAVVHAQFGKRAALKIAHADAIGPKFTSRAFLREASMANRIAHPGVVEVFATGSCSGRPWLAMERLAGRSLGALVEHGPLPRAEALALLRELCDVLGAAHAAGVTHRDLKLDNVFVLDAPIEGRRIKLLDWGMARVDGQADPFRGLIAGTLTYVAPEQVRGDDITPAADIYALAVLAYQLLLGEPPFASPSDLELLDKHLRDAPFAPRSRWAEIPAALDATLLAMLSKQPAERPPLDEVARALAEAADDDVELELVAEPSPVEPAPRTRLVDIIGRPVLGWLSSRRQRAVSGAVGVALTVASVLQVIIA